MKSFPTHFPVPRLTVHRKHWLDLFLAFRNGPEDDCLNSAQSFVRAMHHNHTPTSNLDPSHSIEEKINSLRAPNLATLG